MKEDIEKAAKLSLIEVDEEKVVKDIENILTYVDDIKNIPVSDSRSNENINVFREDKITIKPNQYSDKMFSLTKNIKDRLFKVKKTIK